MRQFFLNFSVFPKTVIGINRFFALTMPLKNYLKDIPYLLCKNRVVNVQAISC